MVFGIRNREIQLQSHYNIPVPESIIRKDVEVQLQSGPRDGRPEQEESDEVPYRLAQAHVVSNKL